MAQRSKQTSTQPQTKRDMLDWLPLFGFGILAVGGMLAIARYQTRSYQGYLKQHTDETRKMTENQDRIISQGEQSAEIQKAQILALERIANALEKP